MSKQLRCAAALAFALFAGLALAAGEESIQLQDAPGRDLVVARCSVCHSVDYVQMNAPVLDRAGWQKSVRKMIDQFGAPIGDEDANRIIEYLATHYGGPIERITLERSYHVATQDYDKGLIFSESVAFANRVTNS